jgi:hypothetical protein
MRFYLGTHLTGWLGRSDVPPLFLSRIRLEAAPFRGRRLARYALDSGGFSEIATHGKWTITTSQYVGMVRRYCDTIGPPEFAACMDWMCEPVMMNKTRLTVREHQRRTTDSYLSLRAIAPEIHWLPVLQGYQPHEYLNHVRLYSDNGVDLSRLELVGVGSVCRRQSKDLKAAAQIIHAIYNLGIRMHAFGFKSTGLEEVGGLLASADSMAWSFAGRHERLPGCTHGNCANCHAYAMKWYTELQDKLSVSLN